MQTSKHGIIIITICCVIIGASYLYYKKLHTVAPGTPPIGTVPEKPIVPEEQYGEVMLSIGETKKIGTLTITVLALRGDSRCPEDVQCIQKGEASFDIRVSRNGQEQVVSLTTDTPPLSLSGHQIHITNVSPIPHSKKTITNEDYRISFLVSK